jgi:Calcium-binding EGF domain/EGF domain
LYDTRSIFRLFRFYYTRRGALPGTCPSVCRDICQHAPCLEDFDIIEESAGCECIPNAPSRCGSNTQCVNDQCRCLSGYTGNPLAAFGCVDNNECSNSTLNNCVPNSVCTNTPGSFSCSCQKGYSGNPTVNCSDIDECSQNGTICGAFGTCQNVIGAYACNCSRGYLWDAPFGICNDINECQTTDCGPNSKCTNTPGNYTCTCLPGFASAGIPPTQPCADINECTTNPNICGNNATCTNTNGNYTCACNRGFIGQPPNCFADLCTIARNGTVCGSNTLCNNSTQGQPPFCQCLSGYEGNPETGCTDIDECNNANACPSTTQCFNQDGSFKCLVTLFNVCPTKEDSTCIPGLKCAQTSRSDSTYRCCPTVGNCSGGVCCNGAYREGELCPSRNSLDCEAGTQCARTALISTTYKCCRNVLVGVCA